MLYENLICIWNVIDNSHKILLGTCLLIFGIIGLGLNLWLFITFLKSNLLICRSYLYLLAFCIANLLRGILILPFSSTSALLSRWAFGYGMCQFLGFLKLMVGIFEMEILALIAVERLVSVVRYKKDKDIAFQFYLISTAVCWILSTVVASLPLAKIGSYTYDTTCISCELDWKMKHTSEAFFKIFVMVIGGVIPVITMLVFLTIALSKERYVMSRKRNDENTITKGIVIMIVLTLLFWFPRALLTLWIPFIKIRIPKALAVMAPLSAEAATIIPVLTYLVYLPGLRHALITILAKKKQECE